MNRTWKIFRGFLIVWGLITFLAFLVIAGTIAYQTGLGNRPSDKLASNHDVRFVLNWCKLGDDRIKEVLHSYASERSFTGDHLDGHAIRISHVALEELVYDERRDRGWHRGDALSGVSKQVVDFAEEWLGGNEMPWFPTINEIRSDKMYTFVWSVNMHGTRPNAAQLIFIRPEDNMVYYFSAKQ